MPLVPFGAGARSKRHAKGTKRNAKVPQKTGGTRPPSGANGSGPKAAPSIDGLRRGHYPGKPYRV